MTSSFDSLFSKAPVAAEEVASMFSQVVPVAEPVKKRKRSESSKELQAAPPNRKAAGKSKTTSKPSKVDEADAASQASSSSLDPAQIKERESRTVFVGNVKIDAKKIPVKKFLVRFGEVEAVRFRSLPGTAQWLRKRNSEHRDFVANGGFGVRTCNMYVVFKEVQAAEDCKAKLLSEDQVFDLLGRSVTVSGVNDRVQFGPEDSIVVCGIPRDCVEHEVSDLFIIAGKEEERPPKGIFPLPLPRDTPGYHLLGVRIPRDSATRVARGVAFVKLGDAFEVRRAQRAAAEGTAAIRGQPIRVERFKAASETSASPSHARGGRVPSRGRGAGRTGGRGGRREASNTPSAAGASKRTLTHDRSIAAHSDSSPRPWEGTRSSDGAVPRSVRKALDDAATGGVHKDRAGRSERSGKPPSRGRSVSNRR